MNTLMCTKALCHSRLLCESTGLAVSALMVKNHVSLFLTPFIVPRVSVEVSLSAQISPGEAFKTDSLNLNGWFCL